LAPVIYDVNQRVELIGYLGQGQIDPLHGLLVLLQLLAMPLLRLFMLFQPFAVVFEHGCLSGLDTGHHDGRLLQFFNGCLHVHDSLYEDPKTGPPKASKQRWVLKPAVEAWSATHVSAVAELWRLRLVSQRGVAPVAKVVQLSTWTLNRLSI